jgi:hypothetical protein
MFTNSSVTQRHCSIWPMATQRREVAHHQTVKQPTPQTTGCLKRPQLRPRQQRPVRPRPNIRWIVHLTTLVRRRTIHIPIEKSTNVERTVGRDKTMECFNYSLCIGYLKALSS